MGLFLLALLPDAQARVTALLQTYREGIPGQFVQPVSGFGVPGSSLFIVYKTTNAAGAGFNPANPLLPLGGDEVLGWHRLNQNGINMGAAGQIVGNLVQSYETAGTGRLYLAVFSDVVYDTFTNSLAIPAGKHYLLTTGAVIQARASESGGLPTDVGRQLANHVATHGPFVADQVTGGEAGHAALSVTPQSLVFAATYGQNASAQTVTVANVGTESLNFSNTVTHVGPSWLMLNPQAGVLAPSQSAPVAYNVSSAAYDAGTYTARVAVTSAEATNSPQNIVAVLTISKANQAISNFQPASGSVLLTGVTCNVSAQGGAGSNPVVFTNLPGGASITWLDADSFRPEAAGQIQIVASQAGDNNYNAAAPVTNSYTVANALGAIQCTIAPAEAGNDGARWRPATSTNWLLDGAILTQAVGNVTLTFKETPGWTKPADIQVLVQEGQTTQVTGTYTSHVSVSTNLFHFGNGVSTGAVRVTIGASQPWSASSTSAWIVISQTNGAGSADISISTAANNDKASRMATVQVSGANNSEQIVVQQEGKGKAALGWLMLLFQ